MKTWSQFTKGRMGPYMKKYGSHKAAMEQFSKEWAKYKAKHQKTTKKSTKKSSKRKTKKVAKKPAKKTTKKATKKKSTKNKLGGYMPIASHTNKGKKKSPRGIMNTAKHRKKK